eukprot:scaffold15119_cov141-Skeletonema_marinoi.AAC.3
MTENLDPNTHRTPNSKQKDLPPRKSNQMIHSTKWESCIPKTNASSVRASFFEKSHAEIQRTVGRAKSEIIDNQEKQFTLLLLRSENKMSARKHSLEFSEIKEGQEEHGQALKELAKAINFMAAEKGQDSRVLGGVVSVGGQSSLALGSDFGYPAGPFERTSSITINPPSMSFEEDSITEPPLSLPEKHLYQEKYDLALKEIAAQKRAKQATDAENKSLVEQLEAYQSKRVKRPENVVRMPPHVEAKQKRAEEQAIERKIKGKGRRKKSEILASSNLPTPYKSKLRSRSNK